MIDIEKWFADSAQQAGVDMLIAFENRLAEEFQYFVDKKEKNCQADLSATGHETAGPD